MSTTNQTVTTTTSIIAKVETTVEVGLQDLVSFMENKVWPDVVSVFKQVEAADLAIALPIAASAANDVANEAVSNLSNPQVLGQLVATTLEQTASQTGKAIEATSVSTAALAVSQVVAAALQSAQAAVPPGEPPPPSAEPEATV